MRKGPLSNFARDAHGRVVNGLLVQKSLTKNGKKIERFYALDSDDRRKYFGNSGNTKEAIRKFRRWQAQIGRETTTISKPIDDLEEFISHVPPGEEFAIMIQKDGAVTDDYDVPSDAFWDKVAEQITAHPKLAAQKTGIEELAYLDRLQPPAPSATLQAIGQLYQDDKRSSMTLKEWSNSKTWWSEFVEITGAKCVRNLDHERFRKYRNTILTKMKDHQHSNAWARSRFGKVKSIINHASAEMELGKEDRAVLQLRSLLKQPPKPAPHPIDILPAEFKKILGKADSWERALFLMAMNCAYYPIDCKRLRWSMINIERGTVRFDREKATGRAKAAVPRVAVLWKRTLDALKKLPRGHEHVFILPVGESVARGPIHTETIARHFAAACARTDIKKKLTFANLRDSALTAAAESTDPAVPVQQYHVLAGHVAKGVDDSYISRNPRFVETACRAIERRYFGPTPRKR